MKFSKGIKGLKEIKHNYNNVIEWLNKASCKEIKRFKRELEGMLPKYFHQEFRDEALEIDWDVKIIWEITSDPYDNTSFQRKFNTFNITSYSFYFKYEVEEGVVRNYRTNKDIMDIDKTEGVIL